MAPKIFPTSPKNHKPEPLVVEIVRPQKKRLSRYKLKKQQAIAEQILHDPSVWSI